MSESDITLQRDCVATMIPSGEQVNLAEGTRLHVMQALGGNVTLRNEMGTFQLEPSDFDALGEEAAAKYGAREEAPVATVEGEFGDEQVWEALRQCYDPEIPLNIVDLGLVYDLRLNESEKDAQQYTAEVKMTLTARGCGMGPKIADDARRKIEALPQVEAATVDIVWDPEWNARMISPEGRKVLGLE